MLVLVLGLHPDRRARASMGGVLWLGGRLGSESGLGLGLLGLGFKVQG